MELKILHMYPDLLNLYGDRGNIITLKKKCLWRKINVEILEFTKDKEENLYKADILFIGGSSDREQKILYENVQ